MAISCSGDILGLMSGGSSVAMDDVICASPDWMMTRVVPAEDVLPERSSAIPIMEGEGEGGGGRGGGEGGEEKGRRTKALKVKRQNTLKTRNLTSGPPSVCLGIDHTEDGGERWEGLPLPANPSKDYSPTNLGSMKYSCIHIAKMWS